MFCRKCGKEIQGGAKFCSACGTPTEGEHGGIQLPEVKMGLKDGMDMLKSGDCKGEFFIALAGLAAGAFLIGQKVLNITYKFFGEENLQAELFRGNEFWKTVFLAAYILAAVLLLVPIFKGKVWEEKYAYAALAVPVLTLVVLIITMLGAKSMIGEELGDYANILEQLEFKINLTASGWFLILVNIVTIVTAWNSAAALNGYMEYLRDKKEPAPKEEPEPVPEVKVPTWKMVEMGSLPISQGENTKECPRCGREQKGDRKCCFECGAEFEAE